MKFLKGLGIIVGLMFGAGVFALPLAIYKAGIFWGTIHLIVAIFITISLLFLYAKITYTIPGRHRFTGYVEKILGKKHKQFAFLIILGSYYASLLIYGVLAGIFISNFFEGDFVFMATIAFFALAGLVIFLDLENIALVNFYLTVPLFGVILFLVFIALPFVDLDNFPLTLNGFSTKGAWFLPYGVWIFAFAAMAAIPEARDVVGRRSFKYFKTIITASVFVSALFYCLFVFAIVGASGEATSADALSGVSGVLGQRVVLLGSIMGFLAVFTSFLALGVDMRDIFRYDYGLSKKSSWLLTAVPPVIIFLSGLQNFTVLVSLTGAVGGGMSYIFTIMMARKLSLAKRWSLFILLFLLLAIAYEIWHVF